MLVKISINKLEKQLIEDKFVIRTRDDKNIADLAYYNGVKTFELNENSIDTVNLYLTENIYKCNTKEMTIDNSVVNVKEWEKILEDRVITKINTINKLQSNNYFICTPMSKITFDYANKIDYDYTKKRLTKFINEVKKKTGIDIIHAETILKSKEIDLSNISLNIKNTLIIQYLFLKNVKMNDNFIEKQNTLKAIKFVKFKISELNNKEFNYYELNNLLIIIKDAIKNYTGKDLLEKKYQHMFMLYGKLNSGIAKMLPFEQEYALVNENRKIVKNNKKLHKEGRIDCIFFNAKNDIITDLYLIELKVNDKVIIGDNGVLTHLDDIHSLIKSNKTNKINKEYFLNITKNIAYYMKNIYNVKIKDTNEINFNIHFYTIFGYTEKKYIENIKTLLTSLQTKEGTNNLIKSPIEGLPKLDSYFENKCINTYENNININNTNIFDYKFFFDKNIFDLKKWNETCFIDKLEYIYWDYKTDIYKINI